MGTLLDYQSSVDHELIKVEDLGMGLQLLRPKSNWVAYASLKYE
jgi:hypothetical protein